MTVRWVFHVKMTDETGDAVYKGVVDLSPPMELGDNGARYFTLEDDTHAAVYLEFTRKTGVNEKNSV